MSAVLDPPTGGVLAPALAALERREQLMAAARASIRHLADGPPVDPDPGYQPRHRRTPDAR